LLNYRGLVSKLSSIKPVAIKATYFRFIGLQYLQSPLSAIGSILFGGRYNLKNSFETLYLAPSPEIAIKESVRGFSVKFPPKIVMSIEVNVQNVIDLGDSEILEKLKLDSKELSCAWRKVQNLDNEEAYTQKIGRAVFSCGHFEAIRYPSALVKKQHNLAVFPERLLKESVIKIYDPDRIIEQVIQGKQVPV
jgi:RES domain-containing protein